MKTSARVAVFSLVVSGCVGSAEVIGEHATGDGERIAEAPAMFPGECKTATDCVDLPTTPCVRPACDGVCYLVSVPDGEMPDGVDQPHGDCATLVCMGLQVVKILETHDPPVLPDDCVVALCTEKGVVWIEREGCYP